MIVKKPQLVEWVKSVEYREVLKNLRLRIGDIVGNELSSANEQQALGITVLVLGNMYH